MTVQEKPRMEALERVRQAAETYRAYQQRKMSCYISVKERNQMIEKAAKDLDESLVAVRKIDKPKSNNEPDPNQVVMFEQ